MEVTRHDRPWMTGVLRAAGIYNLLWGGAAVLLPKTTLGLLMSDEQITGTTIVFWQCIGMIVGVYGVGYWVAATNPLRHWPIVLVGLLGKLFGPAGFVDAVLIREVLDPSFGITIIFNDLIWWVPFGLIMLAAHREHIARRQQTLTSSDDEGDYSSALAGAATSGGGSLLELSKDRPTLVVFLRHFGCTFCRETLADLAKQKHAVRDMHVAIVHMVEDEAARAYLDRYDLPEYVRVSDPNKELYSAFELERGRLGQLFGLRVWWRGFLAGVLGRHGVGTLAGDGFQMPGAFIISDGAERLVVRAVSRVRVAE
ncbi:MAG: peroxiredoxin-like family protein [Planctomycetota bacterium]